MRIRASVPDGELDDDAGLMVYQWLALLIAVSFAIIVAAGAVIGFVVYLLDAVPAMARPGPQWAGQSANVREWFQSLTQPDNPTMSCCGEADAYEADTFEVEGDHYVAVITDGKGTIPNGTHITVLNEKMKWDKGNPTGHGIIFLGVDGRVYCYVAPGGA